MADATYTVTNNTKEQQLEVTDGTDKATLTYRFYKNDIALMHTTVPASMGGKGIATRLAVAAFDLARELGKPVMVYCPFVASFLTKHPAYKAQLDKNYHH
ncbi:hypothetical protein SAMN05444266_110151 [Chitinophaga jiangningensis]|uniref:N-acetyltransferase domain-containing protein n=1 Tax=Chitinophaga jiangningensis TaxID=1419482 RepID=A0A1M7L5A5_9BACT|nr:GNAT family N-acetyltransferase [Chitinophaga jiangningensis]SHM73308.1 hypothetical protein SAMN05444266_110151 [Chitinophaga jiangningensis]